LKGNFHSLSRFRFFCGEVKTLLAEIILELACDL